MDIGIIGAGRLGQAMARTALRAGRSVLIANSHGPESLASVVASLGEGVSAGTVAEAATADLTVIAVPWDRVPEAVQGLDWNGQLVVDATNDWAAEAGGRRVIFVSGDDADAKTKVVGLFQDAGFAPIDLGDLATGGAMQQIHHPLAGVNLIRL